MLIAISFAYIHFTSRDITFVDSDNFKTFKSVDVKRFCNTEGIIWQFILERSPWWGEFYERLI